MAEIGFRIRQDEGGGMEFLSDEDEADLLAKVLPSHASAVRRLRLTSGPKSATPLDQAADDAGN